MVVKIFWIIRAFLYKILFGKVKMLSYIGKPCFLNNAKKIFLGKRVRIYPGARMEVYGPKGKIIIHDNVSIGQNFHITAGDECLEIGSGTLITSNVFITNIDHQYEDISKNILEQPNLIKTTKIGPDCFIGFGAGIQAGTVLGKHCIVGAGSIVKGNFPDYCVIAGVPGKIIKYYNAEQKSWRKI